jgi:hypothetical protein
MNINDNPEGRWKETDVGQTLPSNNGDSEGFKIATLS